MCEKYSFSKNFWDIWARKVWWPYMYSICGNPEPLYLGQTWSVGISWLDWFGALSVNIYFSAQKGKSKDDGASDLTFLPHPEGIWHHLNLLVISGKSLTQPGLWAACNPTAGDLDNLGIPWYLHSRRQDSLRTPQGSSTILNGKKYWNRAWEMGQ